MTLYVARRRGWYKRLTALDSTIQASENILKEQLLDCAHMADN